MIEVIDPGLQFYVDKLNAHEPFAIARYGDGEWSAIVQDRATCVGQRLDLPGLREAMVRSITRAPKDPRYILACHPNQARGNIELWLRTHAPHAQWYDNRTFYRASMHGELFPFVSALRHLRAPLVVIGPPHLRKLDTILPVAHFIEIPERDAWPTLSRILDETNQWYGACFSISAGPTSSPLVWRMFARGLGDGWIIDTGSLWDVYCGVKSRSYHNRIDAETLRRNVEGE